MKSLAPINYTYISILSAEPDICITYQEFNKWLLNNTGLSLNEHIEDFASYTLRSCLHQRVPVWISLYRYELELIKRELTYSQYKMIYLLREILPENTEGFLLK